ncbi:hypothetical protein KCP75_18225 [Salmonella enterica subsp. enterica]|nr:hypothetical protein KCP75_18225 [Salmonella enterica subsp. enterica]
MLVWVMRRPATLSYRESGQQQGELLAKNGMAMFGDSFISSSYLISSSLFISSIVR